MKIIKLILNTIFIKLIDMKEYLLEKYNVLSYKIYDKYQNFKTFIKKILVLLFDIPVDFMFVFMSSYFLTTPYIWQYRLMFSIGIAGLYRVFYSDVTKLLINLRKTKK